MTLFTAAEVLASLRSSSCILNRALAMSTLINRDQCARTTWGQPGLSLFICLYTMCCRRRRQLGNLFGKTRYIIIS